MNSWDKIENDLSTLAPGRWVNPSIINRYGAMIAHHYSKSNKVRVLHSDFYTLLTTGLKEGNVGKPQDRKKWREVLKFTESEQLVSDCEKLFVPIHHQTRHWSLAVVNFTQRRLEYYSTNPDSGDDGVLEEVASYVDAMLEVTDSQVKPNARSWERLFPGPSLTPQQVDDFDCAVFVMQFMVYAATGHFPTIQGGVSVTYLRRLIEIEMRGGLLLKRSQPPAE